ncbi:HEXXH motif domain-containing protein [Streptomycetaceae bacterium NBC_01309]
MTESPLSASVFAALAVGDGGPSEVEVLRRAVLGSNLARLGAILRTTQAERPDTGGLRLVDAYAALARLQRVAPAAVQERLAAPHFGAWTVRMLESCAGSADGPTDGTAASAEASAEASPYLHAVCASAAVRAGVTAELPVPAWGGSVFLPGLGRAAFTTRGVATVRTAPGRTTVRLGREAVTLPENPAGDARGWQGLRRITVTHDARRLTVELDDLDPFREASARRQGMPAAGRLSPQDVERWTELLGEAWPLLVELLPERSESLAAGLRTLVPLGVAGARSFAPDDAFGAVASTLPEDGATLAETLVHEFQHAKLNVVMDLVPLTADDDLCRYSPWRPDPRPAAGVLHGAYAYLGVIEFLDRLRQVRADDLAHFEFARWRKPLADAVATLRESGALTDAGDRFTRIMAERCEGWAAAPVPARVGRLAALWAEDHRVRWRLRNLVPDRDEVARIAADPTAAGLSPMSLTGVSHTPATAPLEDAGEELLRCARRVLRGTVHTGNGNGNGSGNGSGAVACTGAPTADADQLRRADLALVLGDPDTARPLYLAATTHSPADVHPWAGLALCEADTDAPLRQVPEAVRALRLARSRAGAVHQDDAVSPGPA